jgi:hypothetical protein
MLSMATDSVRLNYTISHYIDEQLSGYCNLTGRTASDLVRQLVSELLEGDRRLPDIAAINVFLRKGQSRDRRTDMWMSSRYLVALDEMLDASGYPGKSAVIAYLLHDFLTSRANHAATEMIRISTFVDRNTFTKLFLAASNRQQPVEELIAEICRNFTNPGEPGYI